ncbi:MAG: MAPEG family protein [Dokdonella sp.]
MALVHLLVVAALLQLVVFGVLVGRARVRYGVKAPATSGNEHFERYYRVQMNTLELMILLIPSTWIASTYWNPLFVAAMLAVYLIGRFIYFRAYVQDPSKRGTGFLISFSPIGVLMAAAIAGAGWSLFQNGW